MEEKIKAIVKSILEDVDVENCEDLLEEGLESMDVMSIVSLLEDEFNIEIDPEDIVAENFMSIKTLVKMAERNLM